MKECMMCGKTKPLSEFYESKITKGGYTNRCNKCSNPPFKDPPPKPETNYTKLCDTIDKFVSDHGGKWNFKYETENPLYEKLDDAVVHIMCEYGPDGHCDGHEIITAWILENLTVSTNNQNRREIDGLLP